MQGRRMIALGGVTFIVGAVAFVVVFSYLAASFDYPRVLDGKAAGVLPRLRHGGQTMRAVWAIYAFLPLLLIPGAVGAFYACRSCEPKMRLALITMALAAFSMCLGLMRWPSAHWELASSYAAAGAEGRIAIDSVFNALNLYLGNYIGEFLGEILLSIFFILTGSSMKYEGRWPKWIGWAGMACGLLFAIGGFRNITPTVQPLAQINNYLLPVWMIVLGATMIIYSNPKFDRVTAA